MNKRSSSNDFCELSALMVQFHSFSIQIRFISFLFTFISFNLERNSFNLATRNCHSISRQLDRRSISSQIPISISFIGIHIRTLNVQIQFYSWIWMHLWWNWARRKTNNLFKEMQIIKNINNNEKQCPNALNDCLFVNLNSLTFIRAVLVRIWMLFKCVFNLNALFTRLCEKIMKSLANKIKLIELDSFLNVDLSDHSNSLEIKWPPC